MEVTFFENPITAFGWTGYGYSIVDPDTGVGSYLIEGGSNGAIYIAVGVIFLLLALVPLIEEGGLALVFAAPAILGFVGMGVGYILMGIGTLENNQSMINAGVTVVLGGIISISTYFGVISATFATIGNGAMIILGGNWGQSKITLTIAIWNSFSGKCKAS
jgi:hypothetical protein